MAAKAGVSFMCVYVSKGSEKAKQKENAMMRRNGEEEEEATRYIFSLYSANVQLGCSPPASSSIPHYYCDYHARTMLLLHTHIHWHA